MNYYLLETPLEDSIGLMPSVHLNIDYDKWKVLEKQFTQTQFYEDEKVISFILNEREGIPIRLVDLVNWSGHQRPEAHFKYMVLSPDFKQLMEGFALPEHQFYQAEIFIKSEGKQYYFFVLHFIFDYINSIQLEETVFEERRTNARTFLNKTLNKGEVKTVEDFNSFIESKRTPRHWLYPDQLRFKPDVYLDLFATEDGIIVSEPLKVAIQAANLTGIELTKYTRYPIQMGQKPVQ